MNVAFHAHVERDDDSLCLTNVLLNNQSYIQQITHRAGVVITLCTIDNALSNMLPQSSVDLSVSVLECTYECHEFCEFSLKIYFSTLFIHLKIKTLLSGQPVCARAFVGARVYLCVCVCVCVCVCLCVRARLLPVWRNAEFPLVPRTPPRDCD